MQVANANLDRLPIEEWLSQVTAVLKRGHYNAALEILDLVEGAGIVVQDMYLLRALALAKIGKYMVARTALAEELKRYPNNKVASVLQHDLGTPPESLDVNPYEDPPDGKVDLFLDLTNLCNYKCTFCNNPKLKKAERQTIRLDQFSDLVSLLSRARVVDITGWGEVTLHPDFERLLELLMEHRVHVRVVTNGSNLSERITDLLAKAPLAEVVVSLNSLNPKTYQSLHGRPLERVLAGVDRLWTKLAKKRLMSFSFVLNSLNISELRDFVDFGAKYKTHVAVLGLTPTMREDYADELIVRPTPENLALIEDARRYAEQTNVSLFVTPLDVRTDGVQPRKAELSERIKACRWVYSKFFVGQNGKVTSCCWNLTSMGNIREHSFEEIWNGPKYEDLRRRISQGDLTYCANCGAY